MNIIIFPKDLPKIEGSLLQEGLL